MDARKIEGLKVGFSQAVIKEALSNVQEVMESGRLIYDKFVPEFESILCRETLQRYAVLTSSNTIAQQILYEVLKVTHVVFQGNCFPSPVFAAIHAGCDAIFADINPDDLGYDALSLESVLPKDCYWRYAVNAVSLGGIVPKNIEFLKQLCKKRHAFLIEDAAHSFMSKRDGIISGSWADFSIFSFFATKPMCMGEGGAIVGNNKEILDICRKYIRYGKESLFGSPKCTYIGYNGRPTELLAAVGCAVVKGVPEAVQKRQQIATFFKEQMGDFFTFCDYGDSNFYKMPVIVKNGDHVTLEAFLKPFGVSLSAGIYSIPVYKQEAIMDRFSNVHCLAAEYFCKKHICLPMHEWLSEEDSLFIVDRIKEFNGVVV